MHALIMAGGQSERMRVHGGASHKALKTVLGYSLLERNLSRLMSYGVRHISIAINENEPQLASYIEARARPLADALGISFSVIVEIKQLGNIGAARLIETDDDVLMIYVDNLCALNLHEMTAFHRLNNAGLTISTRKFQLKNPFGELILDGDRILSYVEKPLYPSVVSSGTCILSTGARQAMPADTPCNAVDLFRLLTTQGISIYSYSHETPWIDINDVHALADAEALVKMHPSEFERLHGSPDEIAYVFKPADDEFLQAILFKDGEADNAQHDLFRPVHSLDAFQVSTGRLRRYSMLDSTKSEFAAVQAMPKKITDISDDPTTTHRLMAWSKVLFSA